MDSLSTGILIVLAMVAFNNYKNRTLPDWLKAKFFNQTPGGAQPSSTSSGEARAITAGYTGLGGGMGTFVTPVSGPVTSPFGPRPRNFHEGIDFGVPQGTPVHVARAGKVISAGTAGGYGLKVDVDHGQAVITRYAHLSRIDVRVGDTIGAGATVGLSGSTGESTGPHLHFEIRIGGKAVDPAPYLAGAGALAGLTAVSA